MPSPAVNDHLPTGTGGSQPYRAAGKLSGKKALITGGDSGIGRAVAILYAMEGAESAIVHLPSEEGDALETQKLVLDKGGVLHLIAADLRSHGTCKNVVDEAVEKLGCVNVLVLNHGYQMMKESIDELSEEQWLTTFDTNIHPFFFLSKYVLPQMKSGDTIITCASVNPYGKSLFHLH
jgi:NAD(P)-dependent dehydrogenase (short-subunit alcohol dehydrogenase family)